MSTAVAHKTDFAMLRAQLEDRAPQFQAALPKHIPVERFMRVVLTAIQFAPELIECTRVSLFNAALKAAQDGLLPDGREAAMVVRKNFRAGTKEVSYQPMIAGIRKKARNSGDISSWDAHVVCQNDHFQFQLGDNPQVNHSYDLKVERGPMIGAYSVAVMKDGSKSYEVMSIADIHRIRDQSDGWKAFAAGKIKSTPWSTSPEEMARKTVARRHSKVLPMSSDLDDLIRRDDELYDMQGASDKAIAPERPKTLAGRMDALAAPQAVEEETDHNPETGEIIEDTAADSNVDAETGDDWENEARASSPQPPKATAKSSSKPQADAAGGEPSWGTEASILRAYERGIAAKTKGLPRRLLPPEFKEEHARAEADAWENGWDEADAKADDFPGDR